MTSSAVPTRDRSSVLFWVYLALAVVGLVGCWYFNLLFFATSPDGDYLGGWFANAASSSAAVDIIVVALAACVLFVREGRRLGWPWWGVVTLIVLTFVLAASFTFPLFLALRERALRDRGLTERGPASGEAAG